MGELVTTGRGRTWHLESNIRGMTFCGFVIKPSVEGQPESWPPCVKCHDLHAKAALRGGPFDSNPWEHEDAPCGLCGHRLKKHAVSRGRQLRGACYECDCPAAEQPRGLALSEWQRWVEVDLEERRKRARNYYSKRARASVESLPTLACCEGELLGLEGEHSEDCRHYGRSEA